ncbi:MAG: energy-coupling factor transporter ATPase [Deltaproteobacteria bacterium]|nr:energy-coupling factor transporter ATPase [Deltaproteobacteria bacterium]
MIQVQNLFYTYEGDETPVLEGINVEIPRGIHLGLIGPNGCGKTTLARHLNGLLTASRGDVRVEGLNTKNASDLYRIRQLVGMVFQNPDNQIVGMTVEEDVAFGPGNLALPSTEIAHRVQEALAQVGLESFGNKAPHALSNGEKQLVCMAGVLAMKPRYIILDEPTAYLDPAGRKLVLDRVQKLHAQGITIIHITHHMDEIVRADRVLVMDRGRIILNEKPEAVFSQVTLLKELGLDVPEVTELMWRLHATGHPVRTDILTLEEACRELDSFLSHATAQKRQGV